MKQLYNMILFTLCFVFLVLQLHTIHTIDGGSWYYPRRVQSWKWYWRPIYYICMLLAAFYAAGILFAVGFFVYNMWGVLISL